MEDRAAVRTKTVLSIITPVFNGRRFMESCLSNVVDQNCPFVEHIVVDGGSTDGSVDIIRSFAERYEHIRWISEKDNGQSDAMNKGIQMAQGRVLGFLNADDYYEPGALVNALKTIESLPEPSMVVGNCNVWGDDGTLLFVSKPAEIGLKSLLLGRYMEAFPMNSSAYFYHKSLHARTGLYDVSDHYSMDVRFIFGAVQEAMVAYVAVTWGNYRYLEGTKTFNDEKSGGNAPRVRGITEFYLRRQPFYYRLYLNIIRNWMRVIRRVHRWSDAASRR